MCLKRHLHVFLFPLWSAGVQGPGKQRRGVPDRSPDVQKNILAPGLIDPHMHIESSMMTGCAYAEAALLNGTTTIFCDSHEIGNVSDVEGIEWIRLHYAFPSGFPMDVLDVMNANENICNYLDMPLQHGSSKILKAMKRGINREKTEELIHTIRERVPGIAIRTTLISGFPGETDADFQEMYDWVQRSKFTKY